MFGEGLENDPQLKPLLFVLPQLGTPEFLNQTDKAVQCFQLFDFYIRESPVDNGIIIASKMDCEEYLIKLVRAMNREGLEYPEGALG
jgi:hypothetical protein